jgi:cohesin loading factor subunit SCC2
MKETAEDMDSLTAENNRDIPIMSSSAAALQQAELKKDILHSLIGPKSHSEIKHLEGILDDKSAALVARYLASSRAFSRSFDIYLQQLIRVLSEPEVRMRTRAMKALSSIIDADPSILSRPDMQRAVQYRFMDQSTLVREAAVDLLGRSVLSRPELTAQYYDMLSERILDTGVSVRKRVIKILKDICVLQPQFPRTSEICVKMMRRISDEEGIKVCWYHQHGGGGGTSLSVFSATGEQCVSRTVVYFSSNWSFPARGP